MAREITNSNLKRSPKLILDYAASPEEDCVNTKRVLLDTKRALDIKEPGARTIGPYAPRHLMAGDPSSPSGTKVELSELADDVLAALATAATGVRIYNEIPSGAINGVNTTYVTASIYAPNTDAVFFNGQRLDPGIGNDYVRVESGGAGTGFDSIILAIPPRSRPGVRPDDTVRIDYNPV